MHTRQDASGNEVKVGDIVCFPEPRGRRSLKLGLVTDFNKGKGFIVFHPDYPLFNMPADKVMYTLQYSAEAVYLRSSWELRRKVSK